MHPGGGQYDLLSIFRVRGPEASVYDAGSISIGDFNLGTGTMRGHLPGGNEGVEWLSLWLEHPDPETVIDVAIQTLALEAIPKLPPTNRRIFGCRLMAGLLGGTAFHREYLDARMGFVDTSGYGGGVVEDLRKFTGLFPPRQNETEDSGMSRAAECWLLYAGSEKKFVGVLRTDGFLSSVSEPARQRDLFSVYRRSRSMRGVLAEAEAVLLA